MQSQEILGLDLSISSTGYCKCRADLDTFTITDLGSIKTALRDEHTKGGKKIVDKVYCLQERIDIILDALMFKGIVQPEQIVLVGVESYAFSAIGRGATMLGELQGVIRFAMWKNGVSKIEIAPQTLKAHVIGGGAGKGMVAMHARMAFADAILRWGQELTNDDEADALVLCQLTWLYYRWSQELPFKVEIHKKLLDRLKKLQESSQLV